MRNGIGSFIERGSNSLNNLIIGAVFVVAALAMCWLSGCAQVGQLTSQDATQAAKLAAVVGDAAGVQCWPVLATTGMAIADAGNSKGLLTLIEEKRAIHAALTEAACQPIWSGVLAELLKFTPAAPLVP
jgi:hypothetical protein